ncbi:unnamed protein product [Caretta caretta]
MWGSANGLVGLCKSDESFSKFWTFHCIIHQEQLVSKNLKFDHVMKPVLHIVKFSLSNALNHRQFQNVIEELDEDDFPADLPFHCAVRQLSRGKVISCFFKLREPVKLFMKEKHRIHPKLIDPGWVLDLAFLADMLLHLDKLNVDLQGKFRLLSDLVQGVFAFMNKLQLFPKQMLEGELTHFPSISQL